MFIQHASFHILQLIQACLMSTKNTTILKMNQETSFITFYVPPQNWKKVRSKTILGCKMNIWLPKMEQKKVTSISNTVPEVVEFEHEQIMHGLLLEKCSKPTIKWLAKNKKKPLKYPTCEGREGRKEGRKGKKMHGVYFWLRNCGWSHLKDVSPAAAKTNHLVSNTKLLPKQMGKPRKKRWQKW